MKAVIDASPLIFLTKIGRLDVLRQYETIFAPPEVIAELERGRESGHPEVLQVHALVDDGTIRLRKGGRVKSEWNLDRGEAAVIALAAKAKVEEVIMDDRAAIAVARYMGLRPVSVPFLLLRERRSGRMNREQFEATLRRLISSGYYLSPQLHQRLVEAGLNDWL